jgi:acetyl/propionyl-CoA carboxylase alpha subunit
VTGVDLVRAQLVVAGGGALPWTQASLTQRGHAIEARIYAEDPARDFLPQAGRLLLYREPQLPGVRVDAGVVEGGEISVHYDPMIAKVIASGETREAARARLVAALRTFPILGLKTNVPFLLAILEHPTFTAGTVDTGFLDRESAAMSSREGGMPSFLNEALSIIERESPTGELRRADESRVPRLESRDPWRSLEGWRA